MPSITLALFILIVFLIGGASRSDVQSLIVLRPFAWLCLGIGAMFLSRTNLRSFRLIGSLLLIAVLLTALHLLPLPPAIWQSLPGRGIVSDIDRLTASSGLYRPLSLAPGDTLNALHALIVPVAAFVLALSAGAAMRYRLLVLFLVLGMISGGLGILQILGSSDSPLYFYNITSAPFAVGLFANRNHSAVFLTTLLPLLAALAAVGPGWREKNRQSLALWRLVGLGLGIVIIPLIFITGSRAGLLLMLVGMASVPWIYRGGRFMNEARHKSVQISSRALYLVAGGAVAIVMFLSLFLARSAALDRLLATDPLEDIRTTIWKSSMPLIGEYFPVGSGLGSFVPVFKMAEPDALLTPSYINHAHNDWLELAVTGGIPAIILLAIGTIIWVWRAKTVVMTRAKRRGDIFARTGLVISCILMLASLVDYPLRVPSLIVLFIIALLWMFDPQTDDMSGSERRG